MADIRKVRCWLCNKTNYVDVSIYHWNEFKKRIDDQFEMLMNKREGGLTK